MRMQQRILSLHPWLDSHPLWSKETTSILHYDPDFFSKSFLKRLICLTRVANEFSICVFYFDPKFALLAGLVLRAVRQARLWLVESYPRIVSRTVVDTFSFKLKYLLYRLLYRVMDCTIVHSTGEVTEYARFFHTSSERFRFIPYFIYYDHTDGLPENWSERWLSGHILCAGRHRDLRTFVTAIKQLHRKAVVVAEHGETTQLEKEKSEYLEIYCEVDKDAFYRFFDDAAIVVLPFYRERMLRSLGQIAFLEAACRRIPVITSRTFHLADYASENEVLFFEPENAQDLARKINLLLTNRKLALEMAERAYRRVTKNFTRDRYVVTLLNAIREVKSASLPLH